MKGISSFNFWGVLLSSVVTVGVFGLLYKKFKASRQIKKITILDIIGSTPLVYLPKLSKAIGSEVYVIFNTI